MTTLACATIEARPKPANKTLACRFRAAHGPASFPMVQVLLFEAPKPSPYVAFNCNVWVPGPTTIATA